MIRRHAMPFGTEIEPGGVRFRLWAPDAGPVSLCLPGRADLPMRDLADGWKEVLVPGIRPGARYGFRVGEMVVPDPASRYQPDDVHGHSVVVDPEAHDWTDDAWQGRPWEQAVICELHVGTFTPEGTFLAAVEKLDHLVETGFTAIELMPLSEFPGGRGWGYDGVLPYAPDSSYGTPEDLKILVQEAHARGLMVFLDVVYNHFGPEGNYLHLTAKRFFTDRAHTPWGQAIDYGQHWVREFMIHNALYWLQEFHLDGLRLDAVHAIRNESGFLEELARRAPGRAHLVLENDDNSAALLKHYTAQWNDDIHHALHRLLTGEDGGYYRDYPDPLHHLARCLAQGFAYQGEESEHRQGGRRGEDTSGLTALSFVSFLQNHDQIGNRALGERIHALAPPEAVDAATALLLLAPQPPLMFQGEEWAASAPFQYFCDFGPDLARAVRQGRKREFAHFPQFQGRGAARVPDPVAARTFRRSKLDWSELTREPHAARLELVRRLLHLRAREIAPRLAGMAPGGEAEILSHQAIRAGWRLGDGSRLSVFANFSPQPWGGGVPAAGRLLYSSGGDTGSVPGWGVMWFLDDRGIA